MDGMLPLGSDEGSLGPAAHIVTIGGSRLRVEPVAASPAGGASFLKNIPLSREDDHRNKHEMTTFDDSAV